MSGRYSKKIRKMVNGMRGDFERQAVMKLLGNVNYLPLRSRLRIAWGIVLGKLK